MKFPTTSIPEFLSAIFGMVYFNGEIIQAQYDQGQSKLILVTGDNASGKSFFRKIVAQAWHQEQIEPLYTSQACRAEGGMKHVFIYGSEQDESTGMISVKAMTGGMTTSQNRERLHGLFFDEPEIGLSDDYQAGAGQLIAKFLENPPDKLFSLVISTHSKPLVSQLIHLNPHHVRLGGCPDLQTWLNAPIVPKDPSGLRDAGWTTHRKISDILNKKKRSG